MPRFSEGKFGQAVLVEEGTTNVCTNGSFESNLTGWTFPTGQYERTSQEKYFGSYSLKLTNPDSSTNAQAWFNVPNPSSYAGKTVTVTVYAKTDRPYHGRLEIREYDGSTNKWTFSNWHSGSGQWEKLTRTMTFRDTVTDIQIQLMNRVNHGDNTPTSVYFDGVLFEQKPYATSFINGTRAADNLSISPDVINLAEGEIELTVIPQIISDVNIHFEANAGSVNKNQFMIWKEAAFWRVGLIDKDGTIRYINLDYDGQVGVPTDIKLKWKNINSGQANAEVRVIINGVGKGRITGVQIDMDPLTVAYIGRRANSESRYGNALYDDLRISSIYRSDEDDIAAYESNQPLPVDQYTTCKLSFDGPDGQRGAAIVTL